MEAQAKEIQPVLPVKIPTGYKVGSAIFAMTALASAYGVYHFWGPDALFAPLGCGALAVLSVAISLISLMCGDEEKSLRQMLAKNPRPITHEELTNYDGLWLTTGDTDNSSYWFIGAPDKRIRVTEDVYRFVKERTGRINDCHSTSWMKFYFEDFAHWRVKLNSKQSNSRNTLKWMENIIQGERKS
ncbi:MAG: hypothetical protein G01um101419_7 [Parcubacteria group bacterium Gr01-1014_19]|nr:MAG: hypothetical protein G01um101419_7 [Parcubacteria group bacterium Gr01-1014_19]